MLREPFTRGAEEGDAEAVFSLLTQFVTSYVPDPHAFTRHFPQLLDSPDTTFLVACEDGRVVGYALAFRFLTLYANGPLLELQELMVEPPFRGKGIGRCLVEAVMTNAWESGCVEVTVPTRRAAEFYGRLGFIETAAYLKRKRGG